MTEDAPTSASVAPPVTATRLLTDLLARDGRAAITVMVVGGVVGLLQGVGLLLLIPLLTIIEQDGVRTEQVSSIRELMVSGFEALGLPVTLPVVVLAFGTLMSTAAVLTSATRVRAAESRRRLSAAHRSDLETALQRASWSTISRHGLAKVQRSLSRDVGQVRQAVAALLRSVSTILLLAMYVLVAVRLSVVVTVAVASVGLLLWRLSERVGDRVEDRPERVQEARMQLRRDARGSLQSLKLSKVFWVDEVITEPEPLGDDVDETESVDAFDEFNESRLDVVRQTARAEMVFGVGSAVALSALLYLAAVVADLPLPELLVLVIVFSRTLPRIGTLIVQKRIITLNLVGYGALSDLIAYLEAGAEPERSDVPTLTLTDAIELRDVVVRHPKRSTDALAGASLRVPVGEITFLAGPSGAGKSTLADVLIGLIPPDAGSVAVDAVVLDEAGLIGLRRTAAYLPQAVTLLRGTVAENIRFGRDATDDEVVEALEAASAVDFIERLPEGINTPLRGDGGDLSGGEQQRIALARALLVRPQLLVLDEPDSALDPRTASSLLAALGALRGEVTTVIISHGFALGSLADHLVVLRRGLVVGEGAPSDLSDHELPVVRNAADAVLGRRA